MYLKRVEKGQWANLGWAGEFSKQAPSVQQMFSGPVKRNLPAPTSSQVVSSVSPRHQQ